jgi:hypothetical protein
MVVISCGALAQELVELQKLNNWFSFDLRCIPAQIHNSPKKIPALVEKKIIEAKQENHEVFVAFADCGTGGQLDTVLERHQVKRLPGAHCYQFYAGTDVFEDFMNQELGTFFLTDFLARHFDALILEGMGINKYPELKEMYFGNYKRLVYLSQTNPPKCLEYAQKAAGSLGLEFHHHYTGFGGLASSLKKTMENSVSGKAI